MQKTLASWLYILKRDSTKDSLLYSRMFNSTLFPDPSWLKWSAFQYGHSWVKTSLTSYSQRLPKCTGVKVHLSSNTSSWLRLLGQQREVFLVEVWCCALLGKLEEELRAEFYVGIQGRVVEKPHKEDKVLCLLAAALFVWWLNAWCTDESSETIKSKLAHYSQLTDIHCKQYSYHSEFDVCCSVKITVTHWLQKSLKPTQ